MLARHFLVLSFKFFPVPVSFSRLQPGFCQSNKGRKGLSGSRQSGPPSGILFSFNRSALVTLRSKAQMALGGPLDGGLSCRWRLWPCLVVAILVLMMGAQAVEQTCHDRNVAHCDYLIEKMTCSPADNAVKKTLLLNCGNTCRKEIDICKAKTDEEAKAERDLQLVDEKNETKQEELRLAAAAELIKKLTYDGPIEDDDDDLEPETLFSSSPHAVTATSDAPPAAGAAAETPAAATPAAATPAAATPAAIPAAATPAATTPVPGARESEQPAKPTGPAASWQLAMEPPEGSVPGFWKGKTVASDLHRFQRTCESLMGAPLAAFLQAYETLDRVLFVDASCNQRGVNGLGNVIGDYQAWAVWGVLTRRAVFFKYTDCTPASKDTCNAYTGPGEPDGLGSPACGRADISRYFTGPGAADWALTPAAVARVAVAMSARGAHEHFVRAPMDLPANSTDFFDGLASAAHPWVTVKVEWGTAMLPHPRAAAAAGTDGAEKPRSEPWLDEMLGNGYWRLAASLGVDLPGNVGAADGARSHYAYLEAAHGHHVRGCLLHTLLRPRPVLQAALEPYMTRFGELSGLVALHIRTGFADALRQQPATADEAAALRANVSAALLLSPGAPPLERYFGGEASERWTALNELLAAQLPRANDAPELLACAGAPSDSDLKDIGEPFLMGGEKAAGLASYFTCAGRAAEAAAAKKVHEGERPPGWEKKWALYVSTDSPGLQQLLPQLPQLKGRIIGCHAKCEKHNSAHHGSGSEDSELHTMVDLYIMGLADHVLPVSRSTFQRFADRGFGFGGRPQFLSGVAAPKPAALPEQEASWKFEKRLPVCKAAGGAMEAMEAAGGFDVTCEKFRWAIFSEWLATGDTTKLE